MAKKIKVEKPVETKVEAAEEKPKLGRPTTYDPSYPQKLIEYFSVKPYQNIKDRDVAADFPSFAGFASLIGSHRESLLNWTKEHEDFFDAYKKAKELQENFVIVNGTKGLLDTAFGIFTAKNVLGWRDKQPGETDVVVNNVTSLSDEDLDRKLNEKLGKK